MTLTHQTGPVQTDLRSIILDLCTSMMEIANLSSDAVNWEETGAINSFDERQVAIDKLSHSLLVGRLSRNQAIKALLSEEAEAIVEANHCGNYVVVFDPIDGSREGRSNKTHGTVFGVYEYPIWGKTPRSQVAAGYATYGPRTEFVYTLGDGTGVHRFVLQKHRRFSYQGELPNLAPKGKYFSPGNLASMTVPTSVYPELLRLWATERKSCRYTGSLVSDIHDLICKGGGVFVYPGGGEHETGKLRLAFECGPLAFVLEQLGGAAHSGMETILDTTLSSMEQRTPFIAGSIIDVSNVLELVREPWTDVSSHSRHRGDIASENH